MDPLEQRLIDAGATWRQSQPESPDLDRMLVALRGRRSGPMPRSLMYTFLAGLLLVAALAVAPAVGSFLHLVPPPAPLATASPSIPPSAPSGTPEPSTPSPSPSSNPTASPSQTVPDAATATALVDTYESALVAGQWQTAFDLLATTSPTAQQGFATYRSDRIPYFQSVAGRYTIGEPAKAKDLVQFEPLTAGANPARAWFIEVDYPALAGNNAGYEQFVVAPDASGTWRIWPVR